MDTSRIFSFRYLRLGLIGVLIAGGVCSTTLWHGHAAVTAAPAQFIPPLSANDVSLLFPAPTKAEDFAKLIAVRDLTTPNPQDPTKRDLVWPYAVFQRFITTHAAVLKAAQIARACKAKVQLFHALATPLYADISGIGDQSLEGLEHICDSAL